MSSRLNGTYVGYRSVKVAPGTDRFVTHTLSMVKLVANVDGTAFVSDQGIPLEGHIEYGGNSATFVPEKIAGVRTELENERHVKDYTIELKPIGKGDWLYKGTYGSVKIQKTLHP